MKKIIIVVVLLFSLACNQKKSYLESLSITDIDLHIKYQDSIFKLNNKYPKDLYYYYDKLINDNSDSASVYYYRGRIDSIKSVTVDYYKKSLQKDSNFFYGLISLALYSIDDDLTKEAIKFANKAKKKAPERNESYVILQNAYAILHDKSDNVYQKLKFTKLAIENTEKAYQLTNDEKYLEYLNQYTEIKNNEENIINYNNAVNQYNNNYKCVGRWVGQLNGSAAWTFELNIYSNGNWMFYSYPYKKELYGTYDILKSGDYFELNLNTNTSDAEKMVYNGLQEYTLFECYGKGGEALTLRPRITRADLVFPYEKKVTFYRQ